VSGPGEEGELLLQLDDEPLARLLADEGNLRVGG